MSPVDDRLEGTQQAGVTMPSVVTPRIPSCHLQHKYCCREQVTIIWILGKFFCIKFSGCR